MIWKSRREGSGGCGDGGKGSGREQKRQRQRQKTTKWFELPHMSTHKCIHGIFYMMSDKKLRWSFLCAKVWCRNRKKRGFARETYMSWINTEMRGNRAFLMQIYTRARVMEVVMAKLEEMKREKNVCSAGSQFTKLLRISENDLQCEQWVSFDCLLFEAGIPENFLHSHFHINRHVGTLNDQHKDAEDPTKHLFILVLIWD